MTTMYDNVNLNYINTVQLLLLLPMHLVNNIDHFKAVRKNLNYLLILYIAPCYDHDDLEASRRSKKQRIILILIISISIHG